MHLHVRDADDPSSPPTIAETLMSLRQESLSTHRKGALASGRGVRYESFVSAVMTGRDLSDRGTKRVRNPSHESTEPKRA
jgi:hypothetical protein